MKNNQPVTDHEVLMDDGQTIVSKTDLKGRITYINQYFLDISGFTEQELIGKSHNIVRHPEMPSAAFQDLWKHMKLGRPWVGMVKNRCKNGDYYWVEAHVTPMYENGNCIGYMSVRTKPSREQVSEAEELYRDINAGNATLTPEGAVSRMVAGLSSLKLKQKFYVLISAIAIIFTLLGLSLYDNIDPTKGSLEMLVGELAVAFLILFVTLYMTVNKTILKPLRDVNHYFRRITEGYFTDHIDIARADEIGDVLRDMKSMQIKVGFDINDSRVKAAITQRIKVALDNVSTNVMVADNDGNIIYVNKSVVEMMWAAEDDLRKDLPDFSAKDLLNSNIDGFHKHPQHQREMLARLSQTYSTQVTVGGHTFSLVANPVVDDSGERLGTSVEWQDITQQLNAEQQVETLISEAIDGKLDSRLETDLFKGFMKTLSDGINKLMDAVVVPLKDVKRVIGHMAEGDLSQTMEGDFRGEFAELRDAINTSMTNLMNMVQQIHNATTSISTGANEIAKGNLDLSQRTEEQASSLEETASSMEEMTSTVKQNADNARQANQLAVAGREQAEHGGEVVSKAVSAMFEINNSSKKIAAIISVIDEIAFQTNLLALNAAVEAARAGEQGRGFAVVAGEVRNLAQRSAGAAKEIKDLIEDSVAKVDEGSELVDQSGKALEEIVTAVNKVSDIIAEIAAASQEQSSGIEQVNSAITQMDEVTQQNAALVEEAAAASQSLNEQGQRLTSLIGFFKIGNEPGAGTSSRIESIDRRPAVRSFRASSNNDSKPAAIAGKDSVVSIASSGADESEWEEF
ncbi:Methyl-accepting chemotaxis protein I (serine chemoreceptor protein) [hydrothermal vent metagenome]|uniref:Methyl-accepting chemotaxis protein I (Serine chemoreceptor protein) n=1 Tax=hydrothermal vent metagenome TaxID=652676 RepID=A0A3B1C5D7_9ZZZZ